MNPHLGTAHGRVEVLGNHTDYNQGLVLAMGVEFATEVRGSVRKDDRLVFEAKDLKDSWEGTIQNLTPSPDKIWANYILGLLHGLKARGIPLRGLNLVISSNLPMGAGLSSSAALTVATQRCLQKLWNFSLPPIEMAKLSQEAEHRYAGVKCGLLDPMAILHAKKDHLMLLDFQSLEVESIPFPSTATFVITACGEKHALVDGEYNERRSSCEEAARLLGVDSLREVTPESLSQSRTKLPERIYRRALHVVSETDRVDKASFLLKRGDLVGFGKLLDESHESSRLNFENSIPALDLLCAASKKSRGHLGARLSGGGFGGSTLHLVDSSKLKEFLPTFEREASKLLGHKIRCFTSSPSGS
ncbi:MAG: galactokinase [Verrucomicrobia bacterium]|nr:galactokinase [Verrucomicrobiota bacterium]